LYGSLNSYDGDPNVVGCNISQPGVIHTTQGDDNGALTLRDMVALGKKTMKRPARADELVCCSRCGKLVGTESKGYGVGASFKCKPCYERLHLATSSAFECPRCQQDKPAGTRSVGKGANRVCKKCYNKALIENAPAFVCARCKKWNEAGTRTFGKGANRVCRPCHDKAH